MIIMKIAIPVNDDSGPGSKLTPNYSQCSFFLIVGLDNGKAVAYNAIPNEVPPNLKGVRGATAFLLAGKGVEAVIVHRIAETDRLTLVGNNIRIFTGADGTASDAIGQYLAGGLKENSECKSSDICGC
jgi:predicted Fe-Mo cluster-binding NifX family protein